jgi:hypothetical protein
MKRTARKNLFDDFNEQLDVIAALKKATAVIVIFLTLIAALAFIHSACVSHPDRHAVRLSIHRC